MFADLDCQTAQISYDDRAKWTEDRLPRVLRAGRDPLHEEHRRFWLEAEEPWQARALTSVQTRPVYAEWRMAGRIR